MFGWLWFSVFEGFYLAFLFVRFMYRVIVPRFLGPMIIWYGFVTVCAFLTIFKGWSHVKATMIQRWINRELEDKELTLDQEPNRRKALAPKADAWIFLGYAMNGWIVWLIAWNTGDYFLKVLFA
jgi:hypothetical protein